MKRNAACVWFAGLVVSAVCSGAVLQAQAVSHAFNAAAAHDAGAISHLAASSHLGSDMRAAEHLHTSGEASHISNIHPSSSEYRPIETHTSVAATHASTVHPSSSEYRAIETHATVSRDVPKVQAKPEPRVTGPAGKAQTSPRSPEITPNELMGKTRSEIRDMANEKGLVAKGDASSPDHPRRWSDPVSNKERLRLDRGHVDPTTDKPYNNPNAASDHVHGYDTNGNPIKVNGDKHIPTSGGAN